MSYTLRFQIKPLLAEYLYGRYADSIENGSLHLPAGCYLQFTLQESLSRRPANAPLRETGNLCLRLTAPHRGKNPASYNYLTQDAIRLFEQRTLNQLQLELFDRMMKDRRLSGVPYIETVRCFIEKYNIVSISEDGLMKAFWRWKRNMKSKTPG